MLTAIQRHQELAGFPDDRPPTAAGSPDQKRGRMPGATPYVRVGAPSGWPCCGRSATLQKMRPWDKHPPWAHSAFYLVWAITGTFGPIVLIVGLLNGSTTSLWIAISMCLLWGCSLAIDWLVVRWLQRHVDGWKPWRPPNSRWLRS